ncbi:MAG: hypothetical protein GY757_48230 [bacterium]|nr:hypothetical protein [bacterium]
MNYLVSIVIGFWFVLARFLLVLTIMAVSGGSDLKIDHIIPKNCCFVKGAVFVPEQT